MSDGILAISIIDKEISLPLNLKSLLNLPSYEILVEFILQRSVNVEDYNIANKIERLLADTVKS
jgi:hypothetical protein